MRGYAIILTILRGTGSFVCYTGKSILYCKDPSVLPYLEEKKELLQCKLGELSAPPDFVWHFL